MMVKSEGSPAGPAVPEHGPDVGSAQVPEAEPIVPDPVADDGRRGCRTAHASADGGGCEAARLRQLVDGLRDEIDAAWSALGDESRLTAAQRIQLERVGAAVESQWVVVRRLESDGLQTRNDLQAEIRELAEQVRALSQSTGTP